MGNHHPVHGIAMKIGEALCNPPSLGGKVEQSQPQNLGDRPEALLHCDTLSLLKAGQLESGDCAYEEILLRIGDRFPGSVAESRITCRRPDQDVRIKKERHRTSA